MLPGRYKTKRHIKTPRHTFLANIAFLAATLIWAAAGPIIKLTLQEIPPNAFLFFRFLIVCLVLLPYTVLEVKKIKIHKKDYINFILLGLFSQTALIGAFWALEFTSVLDYTIIGLLGTIVSIYAGHHYFHDKIDERVLVGIALASLGTIIIVLEPLIIGNGGINHASQRFLGNLIAIIFNATWVIYIVWSKMVMGEKSKDLKKVFKKFHLKPMRKSYPPTLIVAITFFVGLASMIPLVIMEQLGIFGDYYFDVQTLTLSGIVGLIYMAIFSSIFGYMLYQWALNNAHIYESAIYGYLGPIFTLPFAYVLLGETPNKVTIVSGIIIAIGVLIAEKGNS